MNSDGTEEDSGGEDVIADAISKDTLFCDLSSRRGS